MGPVRELVVLGTAAQVPTRRRNHNGYVLRWDDEAVLFDPGEGTQRQLLLAGVSASSLTRICVTHAHGDHCLGLAGVVQRLSLDRVSHQVHLHFPEHAAPYVDRLRSAAAFHDTVSIAAHPVTPAAAGLVAVADTPAYRLEAAALDHRIPTLGWRLVEPDGWRFLPDRLAAAGVSGPAVGELARRGSLVVRGRTVRLVDVSAPRPGQRFAFVMDTRMCQAAVILADRADLLVCEATYLDRDRHLADEYGHLTARQAGLLARQAGARLLVLTHFSQRYGEDSAPFLAEGRAAFPDVVAAEDLARIPVPRRRFTP
jgi:ribonuclease Z